MYELIYAQHYAIYYFHHIFTVYNVIFYSPFLYRIQIVTLPDKGYNEKFFFLKLKCSKAAVHNAIVKHKTDKFYATKNGENNQIKLQLGITISFDIELCHHTENRQQIYKRKRSDLKIV